MTSTVTLKKCLHSRATVLLLEDGSPLLAIGSQAVGNDHSDVLQYTIRCDVVPKVRV